MKGRLIVIEGLDGTGKSTLARGLALHLRALCLSTPGERLRSAREVFDGAQVSVAAQLFYAASVALAAAEAKVAMAAGRDVICDRYWLSTWVYAPERGGAVDLDAVESGLLPADYTLLCEVKEEERQARLRRRGMTGADRDTLAPARSAALRMRYRAGLGREVAGRGILLDLTGLSPEESVAAALQAVGVATGLRTRAA